MSAGRFLSKSALAFVALCAGLGASNRLLHEPRSASTGPAVGAVNTMEHPVFHIVVEPGGIEKMVDCECPTEEYYEALSRDMQLRHQNASKAMLEHLAALEPFFDTSSLAVFSFGIGEKAQIAVTKGKLSGHIASSLGASADEEKAQGINDFAPLKDPSQVRQFVGSTNWIRW